MVIFSAGLDHLVGRGFERVENAGTRKIRDERLATVTMPRAALAFGTAGTVFYLLWPIESAPFIYFQF